jgi:hypothetical protein
MIKPSRALASSSDVILVDTVIVLIIVSSCCFVEFATLAWRSLREVYQCKAVARWHHHTCWQRMMQIFFSLKACHTTNISSDVI